MLVGFLMIRNFFFGILNSIINFFARLKTVPTKSISVIGIFIFLAIIFQCLSGIMLALSLVSDPMMIPTSRDEEDIDDLYTDDFFFLHERGVDVIFIFLILHFSRKLYLGSYTKSQEIAWKNGAFLFLLLHITVFFGLVLCCTHLSDITLTIAANIINTLTFKFGKLYWFLFTDQTLNTDTIIRSMYLHYILGFVCLIVGFVHSDSMHYDYKDKTVYSGVELEFIWYKHIVLFELSKLIDFLLFIFVYTVFLLYTGPEPLGYEIFMWGDIGINTDVRFLGVAPHWYFRGYMGWLLLCPHHYLGIFGLIYMLFLVYFQPSLKNYKTFSSNIVEISYTHIILFNIFILSIIYCCSFLPYGRFYNSIGGNNGLLISYIYIFVYLTLDIHMYISRFSFIIKRTNTYKVISYKFKFSYIPYLLWYVHFVLEYSFKFILFILNCQALIIEFIYNCISFICSSIYDICSLVISKVKLFILNKYKIYFTLCSSCLFYIFTYFLLHYSFFNPIIVEFILS